MYTRADLSQLGIGFVDLAFADLRGRDQDDLIVLSRTSDEMIVIEDTGDNRLRIHDILQEPGDLQSINPFETGGEPFLMASAALDPQVMILSYAGSEGLAVRRRLRVPVVPSRALPADFNRDGIEDIIVQGENDGSVIAYAGLGDGFFGEGRTAALPGDLMDLSVAESPAGDPQLLALSRSGSLTRHAIEPGGALTALQTLGAGNGPAGLASGRLDNDRFPDAAVANRADRTVTLFTTGGGSSLSKSAELPVQGLLTGIALRDMNNDGLDDILVTDDRLHSVQILLSPGYQNRVAFETAAEPFSIATGDINGDFIPDFAVIGRKASVVTVYLSKGVPVPVRDWRLY